MIILKKYYPYIISSCVCLFFSLNSIVYMSSNYFFSSLNVYSMFIYLIEEKRINVIYSLIGVILVGFPAIYMFHKKVKHGNLKNILMRVKYNAFIKKEYLKSLLASLILPVSLIILLIAAIFISNNFEFGDCALNNHCSIYIIYQNSPWFYFSMIIINSWLQSIGFINLAYIADRNSKNLFLTLIRTYILFIITILSTSFITVFTKSVLSIKNAPDFSINNMWNLTSSDKYFIIPTIMNIIFITVTFIVMRKMYKNKEKVMIDNE